MHGNLTLQTQGKHIAGFDPKQGKSEGLIAATSLVFSNWIQIVYFSAHLTVKFDGWPYKTIGHFFYTTSSFVYHLKCISEVKLELQAGNAQFGSKLVIFFLSCMTFKFDRWPWKQNNGATLLCCFKLCAPFHSHWWIQTGVTVWKHPIWVKINNFFSRVTLKFDGWHCKTIGHIF